MGKRIRVVGVQLGDPEVESRIRNMVSEAQRFANHIGLTPTQFLRALEEMHVDCLAHYCDADEKEMADYLREYGQRVAAQLDDGRLAIEVLHITRH
jgi:uncharacterized protein (DUF885 family)